MIRNLLISLLLFAIALSRLVGVGFVPRAFAQTSTVTYFVGCLGASIKVLYNVSSGITPPPIPTCLSGDSVVNWSNGDILGVMAGSGLIGGGLSGEVSLSLLQAFRLPQGCTDGQVGKWNTTIGIWECANDNNSVYTAGSGLGLVGNQFNIADGGVTTAKLADGAVSSSNTTLVYVSKVLGPFSTNSVSTYVDVPDSTLNVTVNRPSVLLVSFQGSMWMGLFPNTTAGTLMASLLTINVDGVDRTDLVQSDFTAWIGSISEPLKTPVSFTVPVSVATGAHTVKLRAQVSNWWGGSNPNMGIGYNGRPSTFMAVVYSQ